MSSDVFYIKEGDLGPAITTTLYDPEEVEADLSTSTVQFRMSDGTNLVEGPATIDSPATDGHVTYEWAPDDTAIWGGYIAEWVVTTNSVPQTFPSAGYNFVEIVPGIETNIGGACPLIAVRRQLGREMTDEEQVNTIHLIQSLTRVLERKLNRHFSVRTNIETHRVDSSGRFALHRGPLVEVSGVTIDGYAYTGDLAQYDLMEFPYESSVVVTYDSGSPADEGVADLVAQVVARTVLLPSVASSGAIKSYSVEGTSITYGEGSASSDEGAVGRYTVGDLGSLSRLRRPVFLT